MPHCSAVPQRMADSGVHSTQQRRGKPQIRREFSKVHSLLLYGETRPSAVKIAKVGKPNLRLSHGRTDFGYGLALTRTRM